MGLWHPEHACCFETLQCASHVWLLLGFTVSRRFLRGPWWKQPEVPGPFVRKRKHVSIGRPEAISQNTNTLKGDGVECMDGARRGLCPSLNVDFSIVLTCMKHSGFQWQTKRCRPLNSWPSSWMRCRDYDDFKQFGQFLHHPSVRTEVHAYIMLPFVYIDSIQTHRLQIQDLCISQQI